MRAYVTTSGAIFGLLVAVHLLRLAAEPHAIEDPWYVLATVISATLCVWAFRVLRLSTRS